MRKGRYGFRSFSWNFLSIYPPKTRVGLPYCTLLSTLLTLTGAVLYHLFLENVNLELQHISCI